MRNSRNRISAILTVCILGTILAACSPVKKAGAQTAATVQSEQTAGTAGEGAAAESTQESKGYEPEEIAGDGYIEKRVRIFSGELTDRTVPLRFYEEAPHVAYMGISQYFDLMLGGGLKVEDHGDESYTLTNAAGAAAEADTKNGVVRIADLPAFENYYGDAQNGEPSSFKDSPAPYLRLREVVYEDAPEPVVFDFAELGIALHGDGNEVWFPVSILSTWLTDIAQNIAVYNGKHLYICRGNDPYFSDNTYFDTEYYDRILTNGQRESDLAAYTYGELGFIFRYMYGYPGRTALDETILREKGLDDALAAYGDPGQTLREELASEDFREFWYGMFALSAGPMEDGHNNTALSIGVVDASDTEKYRDFREYTWKKLGNGSVSPFLGKLMRASSEIHEVRRRDLEEDKYCKCGDTAVILLDEFSVDEEGWETYYQSGGELPGDTMGTAAKGLMKASQDEEIKNVLFDISTNPGGYSDSVAGVLSLMTGRDYLCGCNALSRQRFNIYFDVDRNLDGEIDGKDDAVHYDFNYAVLTSGASFSCGNMFPFLVREEGGVVIGESSGGGSCSIQKAVLSEGFQINISGCKFKLTDRSGQSLENGVTPDIVIGTGVKKEKNEISGESMEIPDYAAFGDMDGICASVREWFSK